MDDSAAFGDALAAAVDESIADAHLDAYNRSYPDEPPAKPHRCPVCYAYMDAQPLPDPHADDDPTADTAY